MSVRVPDVLVDRDGGRSIAVCRWGDRGGLTVIGCHGTPGSRLETVPAPEVLRRCGLDYVTYDRPGYGVSSRRPGRTVADAAADVAAVADQLDIEQFAVIGGSGGAPHALACAALLPGRVLAASAVVPPAPYHLMADDAAYFGDMEPVNAVQFRAALTGGAAALEPLLRAEDEQRRAGEGQGEPDPLEQEAMRQGIDGMLDDVLAVHSPWGFDPATIRAPVDVWFGTADVHAPPAQARWLVARIPHSREHPQPGDHTWPARRRAEIFESLQALANGNRP